MCKIYCFWWRSHWLMQLPLLLSHNSKFDESIKAFKYSYSLTEKYGLKVDFGFKPQILRVEDNELKVGASNTCCYATDSLYLTITLITLRQFCLIYAWEWRHGPTAAGQSGDLWPSHFIWVANQLRFSTISYALSFSMVVDWFV